MQRPKREIKRPLPNPELTPKVPAKRPMNINRKVIGGQQSAQHGNRRPNRQLTALRQTPLTEQEIQSSAMIRMLEQQIRIMGHRHQVEMSKLRQVLHFLNEIKGEREKQLELVQREQYNTKLQIWELKNEVLELKQSIREEKEEGERLAGELQEDEHEQVQ